MMLSAEQLQEFKENGVLVIKSFYDSKTEIEPIQYGIWTIIGLMIKKHELNITQKEFNSSTFDEGYQELIAYDRRLGGEIYDIIKQLPSFLRLVCSIRNEEIIRQIRGTDMVGIGRGSYGIRIDNPKEEKFRAPWHQDYLAQFGSIDGIVLWSSLATLTEDMGAVRFCVGSHKDGVVPVYTKDKQNPEKTGAYALILESEQERINRYPIVAPLTVPTDLVLIDFLTLHASGYNTSVRSRWSMQFRYFNFKHQSGIDLGWRAGYGSGVTLKDVLPEYVLD
jgi:hypothetical protein